MKNETIMTVKKWSDIKEGPKGGQEGGGGGEMVTDVSMVCTVRNCYTVIQISGLEIGFFSKVLLK